MPEAKVTLTDNDVELVKPTVFELVIAPVDPLINCTIGTDTKFVPAIVIVVAVAGAIVCEVSAIVGLVSEVVAKDKTPDPLVTKACPFDPVLFGSTKSMSPEKFECAGAESDT